MRSIVVRALSVLAALSALTVLGGCRTASTPAPPEPAAVDHSRADVAYLQNMVRSHQQALTLAALAADHSSDAGLIALAGQVSARQRGEIAGFQAQLLQWEEPRMGAAEKDAAIPGMIDSVVVDRLRALHGPDFDRLWLASMIDQHRGTLALSRVEVADGRSPDVIGIAQAVTPVQQADLDRLTRLAGAR